MGGREFARIKFVRANPRGKGWPHRKHRNIHIEACKTCRKLPELTADDQCEACNPGYGLSEASICQWGSPC